MDAAAGSGAPPGELWHQVAQVLLRVYSSLASSIARAFALVHRSIPTPSFAGIQLGVVTQMGDVLEKVMAYSA
jgi:hypothetical protein